MEKINFSGGEPFIHKRGEFVGELTRYCKQDLELPSVSIVCNGSLVTERWFKKYGMTPSWSPETGFLKVSVTLYSVR